MTYAYVRSEEAPKLPPPRSTAGPLAWIRANLFADWKNALLTLVVGYLLYLLIPPVVRFAFIDAVWSGDNREACLGADGACWAFVKAKFSQFIYGRYPDAERWRVDLVYLVLAIGLVPLAVPGVPYKRENAAFMLLVFPVLSVILLTGGGFDFGLGLWVTLAVLLLLAEAVVFLPVVLGAARFSDRSRGGIVVAGIFLLIAIIITVLQVDFGLEQVETSLWGGLLVTLVVAITGIVASLPLGILLALGRRSKLPVVKMVSVAFIELWRGVPLITVLFMASVMLPLFMPAGTTVDKLLRALIGVALFSSAYMAENVRAGLQAIPRGQHEGASALGLGYWQTMGLIILPQALKLVIPGIVNTFISLFKDTSLVLIIGLFDLLGIIQLNLNDNNWATPVTGNTGYLFAAFSFWIFCFSMSRYSQFVERRLDRGRRH